MGTFIVKKTKTGIKFNLLAKNKEIIATSEVYKSKISCLKGIQSVVKNAPIANVEDQTKEKCTKEINPKFEVYKDTSGEFRFRLKAKNGQIIVTSEGYKSRASSLKGIESVKKNAIDALIESNK